MTDNVNHPSHYNNGSVECIDAMEAATVNKSGAEAVCTSNIIRYLWRYESKNGLEDVKKAQWYLNRLIAELEGPNAEPVECAECDHVWQQQRRDPDLKTCLVCGKVEDVYELEGEPVVTPKPFKIRCKHCGFKQMPGSPACSSCGEYL